MCNRKSEINPVCIIDTDYLPDHTPVYRYLSIEQFLFLAKFNKLYISQIAKWPDSYEGTRFNFMKKIRKDDEFSEKDVGLFYISCWCLQTEDRCLYDSDGEYGKALKELERNGSAAMWESYCKNGGIRIKTTIGKLDGLFRGQLSGHKIFRGKVYYEAAASWNRSVGIPDLIGNLFIKRPPFRHESEYRYVLISEKDKADNPDKITVPIGKIDDFIDEILVSPATFSNKWVSQTLHHLAIDISISSNFPCINTNKNGKQFSRISQRYEPVSETVGWHD